MLHLAVGIQLQIVTSIGYPLMLGVTAGNLSFGAPMKPTLGGRRGSEALWMVGWVDSKFLVNASPEAAKWGGFRGRERDSGLPLSFLWVAVPPRDASTLPYWH